MKRIINCILILTFAQTLFSQSAGKGTTLNLSNTDNFDGFEVLDSAIQKARVVMTGENHLYVKFNSKMELKMLRYLNQKMGLRNFIIELGAARAHFLNRYISDEKDSMAGKYLRATTSPRYMDLFNRLRKFNETLPDSLKITIWGIDVERFNDLPLMRLAELMPSESIPASIRVGVEAVENASDYMLNRGLRDYERARDETFSGNIYNYDERSTPFYINPSIEEFLKYYDSLRPEFEKWLGDKYAGINEAVGWLREYSLWNEYDNTTYQYIWREENIYKNLSSLVQTHPKERFYGQFGRCHVAYEEQNGECGWYGYHSVINKMRTRYFRNQDSVLTIGIFYSGGQSSYFSDREDNEKIQNEVDAMLDEVDSKSIAIFDLTHPDATLPLLAQKFGYAVVTKDHSEENEDSVVSEVIKRKDKTNGVFTPYEYFGYSYNFNFVDMGVLQKHAAQNAYTANALSFNMHEITSGTTFNRTDLAFKYGHVRNQVLHKDDSVTVRYWANMFSMKFGVLLLRKSKTQLTLGAVGAYGRERMSVSQESSNFLETIPKKVFVNPALVIGPVAEFRWRFGSVLYLGAQAGMNVDVSANQWYYKRSAQPYGEAKSVSAGFSGYYLALGFGLAVDQKDNYENYGSLEPGIRRK